MENNEHSKNSNPKPHFENQFAPHQRPSTNYQNLPPIIQQIFENAIPPPPLPMMTKPMNSWNYLNKKPNPNIETANQPSAESTSDKTNGNTEESTEASQMSAQSMQNVLESAQTSAVFPSENGNFMSGSPFPNKPVNSIFVYSTAPLFQASYFNQFNSFIPFIPSGIYNNPFNQNASPQSINRPMKSEDEHEEKSNSVKNIIIKLGEFRP